MLRARSIASLSLALLLLTNIPVALAQTSDEILSEQKSYLDPTYCDGKTGGRARGQCISDVLKHLRELKHDFEQTLRHERLDWEKAHSELGIDEHRKQLEEYLKTVSAKRRTFAQQDRESRKLFFAEEQKARTSTPATVRGYTKQLSLKDIEEAKTQCKLREDASDQRTCLRHVLQLINPTAESHAVTNRTGP